jgi:Tol biopolymer transport system component
MKKSPVVWNLFLTVLVCALAVAARLGTAAMPDAVPAAPAVVLDEAADRYAGYYQIGPQRAVRYWREGEHFYFGAVGTPQRAEAIPEASNRFSYANGAVVFSFVADADGKVTAVTINQGGREITAPRIEETLAKSLPAPGAVAATRPTARTWKAMSGIEIRTLTIQTPGTMDYWPCFSPDGRNVLFSRSVDGGKTWALFRVPVEGGGAPVSLATLPVTATRASWSAKTGRIAFNGSGLDGKDIALWVMNGDGRNAHAVATPGIAAPIYPSWYPDGKSIGFSDGAGNIVYRMDIDGGAPSPITHQDQVLAGMSSVGPDGSQAVFAGQKNSGQAYDQRLNQIWLVDARGVARTVETEPLQGRTPSWSPDGKQIAFESDRGSPNGMYAAFVINVDGTGLVQVTDYALNANHPVFSPDGRWLVLAVGDAPKGGTGISIVTLP